MVRLLMLRVEGKDRVPEERYVSASQDVLASLSAEVSMSQTRKAKAERGD